MKAGSSLGPAFFFANFLMSILYAIKQIYMRCLPFIIALSILTFSSCISPNQIKPSKEIIEYEVAIDDISAVDISGIFKVMISLGKEEKLTVRCNKNIKDYVQIADKGSTVSIGTQSLNTSSGLVLEVDLTLKSLDLIEGSGAVQLLLEKGNYQNITINLSGVSKFENNALIAEKLTLDLSGASAFEATNIMAQSVVVHASGVSKTSLNGSSILFEANFNGAATLDGADFEVREQANISGSGTTNLKISTNGSLNANLSGASKLEYSGEPAAVTKSLSGVATVKSR